MKALKKICKYMYGVRFLLETDANTFVYQLSLPANYQPEAPVTC